MKRIKEASSIVGLTRRALQFYDDEGMLVPSRSKENYRVYTDDDLRHAWDIVVLRKLGLRRKDVSRAWELPMEDRKEMLAIHASEMRNQIEELERVIRETEAMKKYGLPPICIPDDYDGAGNYVGCVGIIADVLGMDEEEIERSVGEDESSTENVTSGKGAYMLCVDGAELERSHEEAESSTSRIGADVLCDDSAELERCHGEAESSITEVGLNVLTPDFNKWLATLEDDCAKIMRRRLIEYLYGNV